VKSAIQPKITTASGPESEIAPPCTPSNSIAQQILASCAACFARSNLDCNVFVKAACEEFLVAGYLDGLNADGIVTKFAAASSDWGKTVKITEAISLAKAGKVVIAGMTANELGQDHGHLAVVVGCNGQMSGNVTVPVGYAGSVASGARLNGGRLSGTFNAQTVRDENLSYYYRDAQRIPESEPFAMLLAGLHLANFSASMPIAWGKKVSPEFKGAAITVAANLDTEVNFLMACMAFESAGTFSPSVTNPSSHAVGLIQFMPTTSSGCRRRGPGGRVTPRNQEGQ
jgi:hypothetical protein